MLIARLDTRPFENANRVVRALCAVNQSVSNAKPAVYCDSSSFLLGREAMTKFAQRMNRKSDSLRPRALAHALSMVLLGVGSMGFAVHAPAATITVNTTADETTVNGKCSLREAIGNANSNTQGAADCAAGTGDDTIVFDPAAFPHNSLTPSVVTGSVLLLTDTSTGNFSTIDGGGVVAIDGGGTSPIFKTALNTHTYFKGLTLRNGNSTSGGALLNYGVAKLGLCTLAGNKATKGGAINNQGDLTIVTSTLSDNTATSVSGRGGAIYDSGSLFMQNSTVSGNSASQGDGIFGHGESGKLYDTTFVGNTQSQGSEIFLDSSVGHTNLHNTVVTSSSSGANCTFSPAAQVHDLGGNIENGTSCGFTVAASSLPNINPLLGPLAHNGGSTATMAPRFGSPAQDATTCDVLTDQRGIQRPQGVKCDAGATESDRIFANGFESDSLTCTLSTECHSSHSECTLDVCAASACGQESAPIGTTCGASGACDGAGLCAVPSFYGWPTPPVFTDTTSVIGHFVIAYPITIPHATTLDKFGIYVSAAGGFVQLALYTDNANQPGTLVAGTNAAFALNSGNNRVDIADVALAVGGTYWIAVRFAFNTTVSYGTGSQSANQCIRDAQITSIDDSWPTAFGPTRVLLIT
ncbi:CSLREA domain-containing protein [Pseudolysobacter antarcticus]|uniref:CSLREA domain-containing protein n=1 Tax=Pseudolysobacter antarcticus TaxID=2511995 RepID=A0A411HGQ9_9GAMM|nr:choice-of-anchor Q domain-containing protein [Pseudolysobacter antarcticus]QBB69716.1 CSLREA domain-containing protein [Pseudolysobacter antarcticus]